MPTPIGKRVLVELDVLEKQEAGLVMSTTEKPKVTTGTVRFLGTEPTGNLKPGDRVFIGKNLPEEIEIEKKKYLMLPEEGLVKLD